MRNIEAMPTAIAFLERISGADSWMVSIVCGSARLGNQRVLADHGNCVVFNDEPKLTSIEPSMKSFGVNQVISSPQPWTLYFFCSAEKRFRPLPELIAEDKTLVRGSALPYEPAAMGSAKSEQHDASAWPRSTGVLQGHNPVRVVNPNDFSVKVALRLGDRGKDFSVSAKGTQTVYVPDGRCDIYFQYSTDPDGLYQGDSFTLNGNGVEIQIVKVVNGNYGIRKVK
ncbi:MAG: hypothetical protein NTY01_16350 [Verrucomicrobia bacterium]|nr:hypothetical protein [Verrucomicrobiota bacterium]